MSSIVSLFPNKTLVDVLSLLVMHPEEELYQRSIADKTGHALLQVQHALERIEQAGLLQKRKSGNRVYYRIERGHPVYQDLKSMLVKTVALGDQFRRELAPSKEQIRFAFVFGSIAKGEEGANSDIDLLIIGQVTLKSLSSSIYGLGEGLGREINPIVWTFEDFEEKARQNNHFLQELMVSPKIWLIGDQDEFARVAQGRAAEGASHFPR